MTPGPKKSGGFRKGGSTKGDHLQQHKFPLTKSVDASLDKDEVINSENEITGSKYRKRGIVSNLDRYKEPEYDRAEELDAPRGSDYETLLSYSTGAGTQHHFSDEKEWEDSNDDIINLTFNLNDLSESMKCIPFNKKLDLPEKLFKPSQLNKMYSSAEQNKKLYLSKMRSKKYLPKTDLSSEFTFSPHSDAIIQVEKCSDSIEASVDSNSLPKHTEALIDSLASSLTFKPKVEAEPRQTVDLIEEPGREKSSDGLDFLLSLSIGNSTSINRNEPVKSKIANNDVDAWLSNILDD